MFTKLICLLSLVLVLLVTGNTEAGLVGHWRLDGSAADSSGNGHDGEIFGEPKWVEGKIGGAMEIDGDDWIEMPGTSAAEGFAALEGEVTWAAWFNTSNSGVLNTLMAQGPAGAAHIQGNRSINIEASGVIMIRAHSVGALTNINSTGIVNDGEWHHVAVTIAFETDGTNDTMKVYIDGDLSIGYEADTININQHSGVAADFIVTLGARGSTPFNGLIDDVRIYDHVLSEVEILSVMAGKPYPYAFGPEPADGAQHEDTWVNLSWLPGELAVSHDVYMGDNFNDVNNGIESTFLGNQTGTFLVVGFPGFPYPDGLVPGTTYYWRVDEVNDAEPNSPWKGDIWSFWIPPKKAHNLEPANGVKFVDPNVILSWTAGFGARLHTVYFGDTFDDVNDAVVGIPQTGTTYRPFFGPLELDKTYYWRVDEFDGVETYKGDVLSFTTKPVIPIIDPNLVGWWTFDEGIGNNALDRSGHGHDGRLLDDPQWVDGYDGGALEFDGSGDIVEVEGYTGATGTKARTCSAWFKTEDLGEIISWGNNTAGQKWIFRVQESNGIVGAIRVEVNGGYIVGFTDVRDGRWHHAAAVLEDNPAPDVTQIKLYLDGELQSVSAEQSQAIDTASGSNVRIGQAPWGNRPFTGLIDDVRIYDYAMTAEEIKLVMRGDPLLAWDPSPPSFSLLNLRDAGSLNWSPGDNASQHDVYFSTDKEGVTNADASDTTGIYRGRQGSISFNTTQDVEWGGGPYYWRIDEVSTDGSVSKGRIWNFTVADFIVIDDFESYNDLDPDDPQSNRIFNAWIDGFDNPAINGSIVGYANPPFAEQSIVNGGSQSMPFAYDNAVGKSEATLTLTSNRDWTENGVSTLVIWYIGDAANSPEKMYVVLNGTAAVTNDNSDAALVDIWTEWNIDLQTFTDQGINLTNVNTITLGFGNRSNPVAGGAGMVFFDDIRLYRPTQ